MIRLRRARPGDPNRRPARPRASHDDVLPRARHTPPALLSRPSHAGDPGDRRGHRAAWPDPRNMGRDYSLAHDQSTLIKLISIVGRSGARNTTGGLAGMLPRPQATRDGPMALLHLTEEQIRTWTREQKDRWWFDNVFRGNMPQLTLRSAITGFLLGGLLSVTNLYVGAKTGWTLGVGLTSVILAFAIFRVFSRLGAPRHDDPREQLRAVDRDLRRLHDDAAHVRPRGLHVGDQQRAARGGRSSASRSCCRSSACWSPSR